MVPTDFSATALEAARYAASIAQINGATIYLVHVIPPVTDAIRQPYPLHDKLEATIATSRLKELDAQEITIRQLFPAVVFKTELLKGTVIHSIAAYVDSEHIDLVVMGTTGASGIKEVFIGSIAAGTIEKATIPVLTIPATFTGGPPSTLLLATNNFEENQQLLNPLVHLAECFNAGIRVAVFIDTDEAHATDYLQYSRQLDHYMNYLATSFPAVSFSKDLLEGSKFEDTITGYCTEHAIDMMVMISYPKSFLERILRRSHTKKMAFHTTIPLLALPARDEGQTNNY